MFLFSYELLNVFLYQSMTKIRFYLFSSDYFRGVNSEKTELIKTIPKQII
ncbi:hypothetical protein SAMN06265349_101832 [Flavobacterium resistens]|uniref:Uncharacterized protein n=1 Tax=Flavobacterium resistens TaxID=443612 RepID=A0A521B9Q2_9FLAO|nr:hypothetical protein SAMN06265349_101832 [Flavobacterium resistens]